MIERYRPTDLATYLLDLRASPKKSLSQNFLTDGNILQKIVNTAQVQEGDFVLEIGPGPGALTQALLNAGAHLLAVEKDPLFAEGLRKMDGVEMIEGDFLKLPLEEVLHEPCKVVANLPYNITTPILAKLFPLYPRIIHLTVMVQKDVGERMIAKPRTKNYSRLSLFTNYFSNPKLCFTVSPNSFYPKPRITSCVMHLELKTPPKVSYETAFFEMIALSFQQRRKMLRSSLKRAYGKKKIEEALGNLSLPTTTRPEELSLEEFLSLFEAL